MSNWIPFEVVQFSSPKIDFCIIPGQRLDLRRVHQFEHFTFPWIFDSVGSRPEHICCLSGASPLLRSHFAIPAKESFPSVSERSRNDRKVIATRLSRMKTPSLESAESSDSVVSCIVERIISIHDGNDENDEN
jgi:hypothetical protein